MVQRLKHSRDRRLLVGLTGGFGTGKTTVAKLFQRWGAERLDADRLAHGALEKSSPVYRRLARLFKDALAGDGRFVKAKLAGMIFTDAAKRKQLERIVHPYVFRRIAERTVKSGKTIIIAEVPLLFESGFERRCDLTVAVYADPKIVRQRLRARGFSEEEILMRTKAQMSLALKTKKANAVINNSGKPGETKRQAKALWGKLCAASKRRT